MFIISVTITANATCFKRVFTHFCLKRLRCAHFIAFQLAFQVKCKCVKCVHFNVKCTHFPKCTDFRLNAWKRKTLTKCSNPLVKIVSITPLQNVRDLVSVLQSQKTVRLVLVHCAKIMEYIRGRKPSHLICIVQLFLNIRWHWKYFRTTKTKRNVFRSWVVLFLVSDNQAELDEADALLFHLRNVNQNTMFPKRRKSHQRYQVLLPEVININNLYNYHFRHFSTDKNSIRNVIVLFASWTSCYLKWGSRSVECTFINIHPVNQKKTCQVSVVSRG